MTAKLLTTAQAAERLNLSTETVRKYCQAGTIRATMVGKSWAITPDALAEFTPPKRNGFRSVPQRKPKTHDPDWTAGATGNVKPDELAANRARIAEIQRRHREGRVQALELDSSVTRVARKR